MDLSHIPFFAAARDRLAWLDRRQQVLAQNIAHADTPGYQPSDLKTLSFAATVRQTSRHLPLTVSDTGHRSALPRADSRFADAATRRPFETAPAGNAVILEEQMAKVNETVLAHDAASGLYRKYLGMMRLAIGERR